jgi:hypothetical protein
MAVSWRDQLACSAQHSLSQLTHGHGARRVIPIERCPYVAYLLERTLIDCYRPLCSTSDWTREMDFDRQDDALA